MLRFTAASALLIATAVLGVRTSASPQTGLAAPSLTVQSVARGTSSVVVHYAQVDGAKDYRVYDPATNTVKYAGLVHLTAPSGQQFVTDAAGTVAFPITTSSSGTGGTTYDGPADSIEWNAVEDNAPHTVYVQAVNALGPVPQENLYTGSSAPLVSSTNGMLGANEGLTSDGYTSINGQGPDTNTPTAIASSPALVVQDDPTYRPIPSSSVATNTYLDGFADSEPVVQTAVNAQAMTATYRMNAGTPLAATIDYHGADTLDSFPMIADGHFMDVLFDGGTPGTSNPLHTQYSIMDVRPDQTLSGSNEVIHLTMEVDAHFSSRRWVALALTPQNDPITTANPSTSPLNADCHALLLQLFPQTANLSVYTAIGTGATCTGPGAGLWGSAGQGQVFSDTQYMGLPWNQWGTALDHRVRVDFFVSQGHAALFINGHLAIQSAIPAGSWDWMTTTPLQASFIHYVYHTALDRQELMTYTCTPLNSYWFNDPLVGSSCSGLTFPSGYGFSSSDERHWDNLGFEQLPPNSSSDWSGYASDIVMPVARPPVFAGSTPTPQPTAQATATATTQPTATPQPTVTATTAPTATQAPVPQTPAPTPTDTAVPPTPTQAVLPTPTIACGVPGA